ncbi:MucBP domain-containing protein [Listeria sp. PSOL-1]|uniref:MucBP domain-containing protein n=1 Tax=Listeria sp. PSOL-1 TaxID=1844999 RepID=UPI0013CFC020|nr:MucBP domain-containing protein [Listeria sp. PSOL-1]
MKKLTSRIGLILVIIFASLNIVSNNTVKANEISDIPDWATSYMTDDDSNVYAPGSKVDIIETNGEAEFTLHTKKDWTFESSGDGKISLSPSSGSAGETRIKIRGEKVGNVSMQIIMPGTANDTYTVDVKVAAQKGQVAIHYIDENGHKLADDDTLEGIVGDPYKSTVKNILGYRLKTTEGETEGSFSAETKEINYVYTSDIVNLPKSKVVVHYNNEEKKQLAADETLTGSIGESYKSEQKLIRGYHLKEINGSEEGRFTAETQVVEYVYAKDRPPLVEGDVVTHYEDEKGHQIAKDEVIEGKIGAAYQTTPENIVGYYLKDVKGEEAGNFRISEQEVTYVYTKDILPVIDGKVVVHYEDEEGYQIETDEVIEGKVGEPYEVSPKNILDYHLKDVKGNEKGNFTMAEQEVTYIYTKEMPPTVEGEVTTHYKDEEGHKIAEDKAVKGKIGESYKTSPENILNYHLKDVEGEETGNFTIAEQEVTYIYTKEMPPIVNGQVSVHYQDENGVKLSADETLEGKVNDPYKCEPKIIPGYELKEVAGEQTGHFTAAKQEVKYIYAKEMPVTSNGKVIIRYEDEQGKKLAEDKVLEGEVGEAYKSERQTIADYKLKEVKGHETGVYTTAKQEIIYVYTAIKAPGTSNKAENTDEKLLPSKPTSILTSNKAIKQILKQKVKPVQKDKLPKTGDQTSLYLSLLGVLILGLLGLRIIK